MSHERSEGDVAGDDPSMAAPGFHDAPTQIDAAPNTDPPPAGLQSAWPWGMRRLGDRYQLEEPIASGGAAVVWRGFDDVLSRSIAIKLLHPHLATDPTTVERFRLESINAARLTHPNVVAIYDHGQQGDVVYLVMEFVDGPSLRDILRASGPLDADIVAALGEQVASALGEAHAQGIVHRDIKPANILLTADGVAKVTDFGIAKALSGAQATLTNPGTVVGTAAYVAPEQLEGSTVDARADVYALGVVLYECLTGQPAFQGDTPTATAAARLTHELLPPRQIRADVPRGLDEVIVRATRRDPELRFVDGAAMAATVAPLVEARPSDVTAMLLAPSRSDSSGPVVDLTAMEATSPRSVRVPATRAQYSRRLVAAFAGGLLLALGAFLGAQALRSDAVTPAPIREAQQVAVASAGDFDPSSRDQSEHSAQVPLAYDGDLATAWTTERYRQPLGQRKPGVGIWFDLGAPVGVEQIVFDVATPGLDLEVYATDTMPDITADGVPGWGRQHAARDDLAAFDAVDVSATARYWLLWLTDLPPVSTGIWQGGLTEVRFLTSADS